MKCPKKKKMKCPKKKKRKEKEGVAMLHVFKKITYCFLNPYCPSKQSFIQQKYGL